MASSASPSSTTAPASMSDRDSNALGGLFQNIITDLRNGANNWDDLLLKANKFHSQLKSTINSSTAFLDAFQKIADMATTTRGGTKEIGSALTRLCLRNRSVEAKLKSLNNSLLDSFISPLQDRVDEWKKLIVQLDKEHGKEIKRLKQFRKKQNNINDQIRDREMSTATLSSATTLANVHTFRMRKHHHHSHHQRNKNGKNDVPRIGSMYEMDKCSMSESSSSTTTNANPSQQQSLSSATSMSNIDSAAFSKEKFLMIDDVERNYVRRALIEERSHYCFFFNLLRPVIEEELSMIQEMVHLEEILQTLISLTNEPNKLPSCGENFLVNIQNGGGGGEQNLVPVDLFDPTNHLYFHHQHHHHQNQKQQDHYHPLPSRSSNDSMSSPRSRKSSISSMESFNTFSTDSMSIRNCKSLSQPNINPGFRPKSIASQDSGFLSHDYNVPSVGRLLIFNPSKQRVINQSTDNGNESTLHSPPPPPGTICVLNDKPILCSSRILIESSNNRNGHIECPIVEYATSEPFYNQTNTASLQSHCNLRPNSIEQPIYVNINESPYSTAERTVFYGSEETLTPTNSQTINLVQNDYGKGGDSNLKLVEENNGQKTLIKPKRCPPKPPVRHSSKLSTVNTNTALNGFSNPKQSTLIYVRNPDDSSDFPPPPPEAYLAVQQKNDFDENCDDQNICCRLSLNQSHLVYCDKKDCLEDFKQTNLELLHRFNSQKFLDQTKSLKNFGENLDDSHKLNYSSKTWRKKMSTSVYYDCGKKNTNFEYNFSNNQSFENRFHSSMNLSEVHFD
ncbi:hypothetical protein NH340_JMT04940 [Sarcoptes scabiei]|nr:hypothetical protein NH340_JMT04940 [Sarcoptes scabiei]